MQAMIEARDTLAELVDRYITVFVDCQLASYSNDGVQRSSDIEYCITLVGDNVTSQKRGKVLDEVVDETLNFLAKQ